MDNDIVRNAFKDEIEKIAINFGDVFKAGKGAIGSYKGITHDSMFGNAAEMIGHKLHSKRLHEIGAKLEAIDAAEAAKKNAERELLLFGDKVEEPQGLFDQLTSALDTREALPEYRTAVEADLELERKKAQHASEIIRKIMQYGAAGMSVAGAGSPIASKVIESQALRRAAAEHAVNSNRALFGILGAGAAAGGGAVLYNHIQNHREY